MEFSYVCTGSNFLIPMSMAGDVDTKERLIDYYQSISAQEACIVQFRTHTHGTKEKNHPSVMNQGTSARGIYTYSAPLFSQSVSQSVNSSE